MNEAILETGGQLPAETQMRGTIPERICEYAGRLCYDSLGVDANGKPLGRSSSQYHAHIIQVNHYSVYEHPHFTVELELSSHDLWDLMNRPGLVLEFNPNTLKARLTFNLRHILDWHKWSAKHPYWASLTGNKVYNTLLHLVKPLAPAILGHLTLAGKGELKAGKTVRPETDNERFMSFFLSGSRGFTHELVRHRLAAYSQRSTRYCDESESPWVHHPLVSRFILDKDKALHNEINTTIKSCQETYRKVVSKLETQLKAPPSKVDSQTARKQARGAARGYLGNALYTELLFTVSVAELKAIFELRLSDPADAEIRHVFALVYQALLKSGYAELFSGYTVKNAKDGLGVVVSK
jgi:flavin-dependent thymidylate synthase